MSVSVHRKRFSPVIVFTTAIQLSVCVTTMKAVVLIGTVTLLLAKPQEQDNCESTLFSHCNRALGNFWNIDSSNIWNDLDQLDSALTSLMRPPYGIDNYVNICNGFSMFYSCLGKENIRQCLGVIGLVGMGKSQADAYCYEGLLAVWRFKCGAGFFAVNENPTLTSCTQKTYLNFGDEIGHIIDSYKAKIAIDPGHACKYAQQFMNSMGTIYRNGPCRGETADSAELYACQTAREYTNAQFKHCQHNTSCAQK